MELTLKQPQGKKPGKKCKRPDSRPARKRYWISGRLALRKIRNLVRSGYSPREALKVWENSRKRYYGVLPTIKKVDQLGK